MSLFLPPTATHPAEWVRKAVTTVNWLLARQARMGRGAPVTQTADFTVADTDAWLINNKAGAACTVTLPDPAQWSGRELMFLNRQAQAVNSASANVVPIAGGAAGTAILPATAGTWATLTSDGTNWLVMQS